MCKKRLLKIFTMKARKNRKLEDGSIFTSSLHLSRRKSELATAVGAFQNWGKERSALTSPVISRHVERSETSPPQTKRWGQHGDFFLRFAQDMPRCARRNDVYEDLRYCPQIEMHPTPSKLGLFGRRPPPVSSPAPGRAGEEIRKLD